MLLGRIEEHVERDTVHVTVEVDAEDGRALAEVERMGEIKERSVDGTLMRFELVARRGDIAALERLGNVLVKPH